MNGVAIVAPGAALGTGLSGDLLAAHASELDRNDAGRNGDDAIAHDHDGRSQDLTESSVGRDVAVADGGHGNDGPVDGDRDAGEAVGLALDEVHHRANDDDNGQDRTQKDDDLAGAGAHCRCELTGLTHEVGELEHPKNAQQPEGANHQKGLSTRDDQAEIGGEDRQQIDDTEEATRVASRTADTIEAQDVLDSENNGNDPLERAQP